jgi:hypothetical protein
MDNNKERERDKVKVMVKDNQGIVGRTIIIEEIVVIAEIEREIIIGTALRMKAETRIEGRTEIERRIEGEREGEIVVIVEIKTEIGDESKIEIVEIVVNVEVRTTRIQEIRKEEIVEKEGMKRKAKIEKEKEKKKERKIKEKVMGVMSVIFQSLLLSLHHLL